MIILDSFFDYLILSVLIIMVSTVVYISIYIRDIPYAIASKSSHPHSDMIYVLGWLSMLSFHILWPFLFAYSYAYSKKGEFKIKEAIDEESNSSFMIQKSLNQIKARLSALEQDES
ncbi:MAG: DUF3302 domain-containing protein [Campylobacterota bacterium]|nr:DUF3302 domain-containing protein [Campylobacterota bacterium]